MTDKLMPTEPDRLPAGIPGLEDPSGLPGLGGQGPALGSKPESKVSGQVLLAGAVLVLAAGAIYGMRFVGLNAGFGGDEVKIDYTSQSGTPEMVRRFGRVMTELDASMSAVQIAGNDALPETPFTRPSKDEPIDLSSVEAPSSMDELERIARMAEEQRRKQMAERAALLEGELARLLVQSVIGGRVPVARINGQPVTVGKQLGPFEVVAIEGQSVFITADGNVWELQIGTPARLVEQP